MPLFQLPQLITQLVNAQVAMTRLQHFLAAEQKPPEQLLEPASKGELACLACHALQACWPGPAQEPPRFTCLCHSICSRQLNCASWGEQEVSWCSD